MDPSGIMGKNLDLAFFRGIQVDDAKVYGILRDFPKNTTLLETNELPLKTDGWNTTFLLGMPYFQVRLLLVSGRVV